MKLSLALYSRISKFSYQYSNLPESYIKRAMKQVYWEAPKNLPQYLPVTVEKTKFKYSIHRPWTEEFRRDNAPYSHSKKIFVEPIKDWSFFRGDLVEVLVGKDKGKIGTVNYIVEERNWVLVEGLHVKYNMLGKTSDFPGVMVKEEQPLLVTGEVALIDPTDRRATEIEWRYTEQGDKVRISKRTGHIIPIPITATETIDYKTKAGYTEQPKDTKEADATAYTYVPQSKTFEMDLMEHYKLV